jgi:hypothetical protein
MKADGLAPAGDRSARDLSQAEEAKHSAVISRGMIMFQPAAAVRACEHPQCRQGRLGVEQDEEAGDPVGGRVGVVVEEPSGVCPPAVLVERPGRSGPPPVTAWRGLVACA